MANLGETPHYEDAHQLQSGGDEQIGDEATRHLILGFIQIIDKSNGGYTTLTTFANEKDEVHDVKSTNLMLDDQEQKNIIISKLCH